MKKKLKKNISTNNEDVQLHDLLFNKEGCIQVKDALERAKKKWQRKI